MKKQLPTNGIANELSGSSVFFGAPESPIATNEPAQVEAIVVTTTPPVTPPSHQEPVTPTSHDTVNPRHHATTAPSRHAATPPTDPDAMQPALLEEVRKAVKQIGKEAATHRFTIQEKQAIDDIVYTYGRQGYRTSENEITRIGVNWLLWDYQQHGAHSVLARLLELLHG